MVTYFFLVVAMYAFLSLFIFALATRPSTPPRTRSQSLSPVLTAIIAAILGLSYYLIQGYHHDMLTDLATVTDANDQQTLFREAYNAIGQYRYMAWTVTLPFSLLQLLFLLKPQSGLSIRLLVTLLLSSFFMILTGYIGQQQLSFDNEIRVGPALSWGTISLIGYAVILRTLYQLWKQTAAQARPGDQRLYRLIALVAGLFWVVYPIGYLLTVTTIDFNWIQLMYTLADLISQVGLGVVAYFAQTEPIENS